MDKQIDSSIAPKFFKQLSELERTIAMAVFERKMGRKEIINTIGTSEYRLNVVIENIRKKATGEQDMFSGITNREEAVRNYLTTGAYRTEGRDETYRRALNQEDE